MPKYRIHSGLFFDTDPSSR